MTKPSILPPSYCSCEADHSCVGEPGVLAGGDHVVGVLHRTPREARVACHHTIRVPAGPRGGIRRADGEPVHTSTRRETAEEVVEGVVLHHEHHDVFDLRHRVRSRWQVRKGKRTRVAQGRPAQCRQRRRNDRLAVRHGDSCVPRRRLPPTYRRSCGEGTGPTKECTTTDMTVHARENSAIRPLSRRCMHRSHMASSGEEKGVRNVTTRKTIDHPRLVGGSAPDAVRPSGWLLRLKHGAVPTQIARTTYLFRDLR